MIDEIAFQTSLLAFKAGIKATHVGESERGFADATSRETKNLVGTAKTQVDGGVRMVNCTQKAIGGIARRMSSINDMIAEVFRHTAERVGELGEQQRCSLRPGPHGQRELMGRERQAV